VTATLVLARRYNGVGRMSNDSPNKRFEQNARSYNDLKALSVCSNATR